MDFLTSMEGLEIQLELKYCERCGGLWLRVQGTEGIHCGSCRVRLAAMPNPAEPPPLLRRLRRRRERVREQGIDDQREDLQSSARIECLEGVATMEVWA